MRLKWQPWYMGPGCGRFRGSGEDVTLTTPTDADTPITRSQPSTDRAFWMLIALPKLSSLGHICQQLPANSMTWKIFNLCPSEVLDSLPKVSSFINARHLAEGSVGFLLSLLEILQPTGIYLISTLHPYPPIPLMLIFLLEILFWEYVLFMVEYRIRITDFMSDSAAN